MRQRHEGFALITVLWLSLLLGLIAASLTEIARRAASSTRAMEAGQQATLLLPNLREKAVFDLLSMHARMGGTYLDDNEVVLRPDGLLRQTSIGFVQIIAANGLIDLNSANVDVLSQLPALLAEADSGTFRYTSLSDTPKQLTPFATIYSGLTAPTIKEAPSSVLRLFPGLSGNAIEKILTRRNAGQFRDEIKLPEAWKPVEANDPKGLAYHIRAWTADPGRDGREWVVYLPLNEELGEEWYLLETRRLAPLADDGVHALRVWSFQS